MTLPVIPTIPIGSISENASTPTSATLQSAQSGDANGTAFSVAGMSTVVFTIVPTSFTGTITFKGSEDGTNYIAMLATKLGTTTVATNTALSGSSTIEAWVAQIGGLQSVLAVTSSTSGGSVTVTAHASTEPNAVPVGSTIGTAVIQANSGTALAADVSNSELRVSLYGKSSAAGDTAVATDSSGNVGVNVAKINGVATTMGNGVSGTGVQRVTIASDSTGQVTLAAGSNLIGMVAPDPYSFNNITTKTDTVVKSGAGHLHSIVINKPGSTDTLTVYDNTAASGTKIASITVTASVNFVFLYDVAFSTGLTVTSGGGTAGDYTVTYR